MAPSADIKKASTPAKDTEAAKLPSGNGVKEQGTTSDAGEISKAGSNTQAANGSQRKEQPVEGSKEGKLSGKELKDKAKAEKAARRAKEKEGRQGQPVADLEPKKQPEQKARRPSTTATGPPSSTPKGQHKRTGSNSISTQKLPLRPAQTQAPPMEEEPEKENKNVSWFDHLYGPPRRTSIAGAGKDVHPAILALGLQMRNYEICGSSCRCVATLLAFKRVRSLITNGHDIADYP